MRSLTEQAGYVALNELKSDSVSRVVILFSDSITWGAAAFDMGSPPEGVFIRFASEHSSLISLVPDTIIIVAADDSVWRQPRQSEGLDLIRNKQMLGAGREVHVTRYNKFPTLVSDHIYGWEVK